MKDTEDTAQRTSKPVQSDQSIVPIVIAGAMLGTLFGTVLGTFVGAAIGGVVGAKSQKNREQ